MSFVESYQNQMPWIVYFDNNRPSRYTIVNARVSFMLEYYSIRYRNRNLLWVVLDFWLPCIMHIFTQNENYIREYWVSFKNNYVEQKVCMRMKIYFNLVWSKFISYANVTKCNYNYYNKLYVTVKITMDKVLYKKLFRKKKKMNIYTFF